uniref:Histidine decarboxylase n=1 Tax=Platynereis dumerilii TaxID=6359 RepID=A0A291FEA2_PLADU|nr:histidine decarboxylase [Platynereis dumerilii]
MSAENNREEDVFDLHVRRIVASGEDELRRMWRRFTEGVLKRDSNEEGQKENCSSPKTSPKMPPKMTPTTGMDFEEYRQRGKEMVDYIADYLENIRTRRVFPNVQPGYMRTLVPDTAPDVGEGWDQIFRDVERVVMPGITHWQSPYMHAYFPALNSFPSLLGDMLADAIGCLGFTWASSPACTELETIVMDWLGKMIGLPAAFLHSNEQTMGGGVIQTTASEATFVSVLAARSEAIKKYKLHNPDLDDAEINARLVAYCSEQAHSSVEKAGLVGLVKLRLLPCDENLSLRGETVKDAIEADKKLGLIPFYVCVTLGTTGACAFDKLREVGPLCKDEDMWVHVDAAYAGTAFICPEFRHFMDGVEFANSFAFNPSKWMMVHFDCTAMWVQNSGALHRTFNVNPLYLRHENTGAAIDYMHWQIPLSRRFRALKLWFVIRSFGVAGLQKHIREGVRLAIKFEDMIDRDERFEVPAKRHLGMVVFRLKGDNIHTERLLKRLNSSGRVHMVPASFKGKYVIRFTVTSQYTLDEDIKRDWNIIQTTAKIILSEENGVAEIVDEEIEDSEEERDQTKALEQKPEPVREHISNAGLARREGMKKSKFGMSLILSNVPMSPKFINGSFAALFETNDVIMEYAKQLSRRSVDLNGRPIRLSPRKRLRETNKQLSFDLSMLPSRKTSQLVKQGSLDSKIQEIFDAEGQYDLDGAASSSEDLSEAEENGPNNLPSKDLEDKEVQSSITDLSNFKLPMNGDIPHRLCPHCGHVVN